MADNCVHCSNPNPENWFYCRRCGEHASNERYSKNMWMRTERGKRSDIEFRTQTMDESVDEMNKERNTRYA